jgi:hypothetical protein
MATKKVSNVVVNKTEEVKTDTKPEVKSEIWNKIAKKPINMFALPNQLVEDYVTLKHDSVDQIYVTLKCSAALPSLEEAVTPDFKVELHEGYVVVKKASKPLPY